MEYVIIGNSTAGIGTVEGIRKVDSAGKITIISDEKHHTYSRPLISYFLGGKVDEEKIKYRADNFYAENNCTLISGTAVNAVDSAAKTVSLSDGRILPYDKLLVGTGSSPFVPPFEGLDGVREKFTFMKMDDAYALGEVLDAKKRVLIVGAGLIGLKCAEGILTPRKCGEEPRDDSKPDTAKKAKRVTIIDLSTRILSSILDDTGAAIMQEHLEARNIEFKLGRGVKKFADNRAVLDNGEEIAFDILVLAVGVRPNVSLLEGIAEIGRGIIVNEKSETSALDIYAAGDCTQSYDISAGESKIMALLPNAYMQGECAGINMAGGEKSFSNAIPMNAIGFFGKSIITAGNYTGEVFSEKTDTGYKCLFYSDNRLNGFIMLGDVDKAGIYTSLIREQTPLDTIDFALICEKPGLMAFTKAAREEKLNG